VAPIGGPVCEVVAVAKRDLKAGERLDGVGGFCAYGLIDNRTTARVLDALPIGLSEGCLLRRDIKKDDVLSFEDVEAPGARMIDRLWRDQTENWPLASPDKELQYARM